MSEVDRLSNSGLYPVLRIGDKRGGNDGSAGRPPPDANGKPHPPAGPDPDSPQPPRSIIDEYA